MEETIVRNASNWQVFITAAIFLICYAFIISEKINRTVIALCGSLLLLIIGIVDLHTAYTEHIHWATIFLLLGMMILVGIINRSGLFEYIAIKTVQRTKGDPKKILVNMAFLTAAGAAFVDNVTAVLIIAPITIAITNLLHIKATPFLITEILICNIGGAATLVGDPPNIMIGTAANFSFNDFLLHQTPVIVIFTLATTLYLRFYYAKHLHVDEEYKCKLMEANPGDYIRDFALAKKSVFVFLLTLFGFLIHKYLHIEPAVIALSGSTLLMLIGVKENDLEEVFNTVEWGTIFFFAGLFVLVGGLVEVGIIQDLATWMLTITDGDLKYTSFVILWGAGLASAFIDNIPLVATMIPMVQDMSAQLSLTIVETNTLWWSLALGACLGGNGTLIASAANLFVASIAAREGTPISFIDFLKVSIPVTLTTLALATVYVYFFFIKLGLA